MPVPVSRPRAARVHGVFPSGCTDPPTTEKAIEWTPHPGRTERFDPMAAPAPLSRPRAVRVHGVFPSGCTDPPTTEKAIEWT